SHLLPTSYLLFRSRSPISYLLSPISYLLSPISHLLFSHCPPSPHPPMRPFLPALLLLIAGCASDPDLVIHNARVFTADPANECAEAVLIRGERIALVGSNDDILAAAGANARLIDAEGRLVIPGLNDAHAHVS